MGATAAIAIVALAQPKKRVVGRPRRDVGIGMLLNHDALVRAAKRPTGRPRKYCDSDLLWLIERIDQLLANGAKSDEEALRSDLIARYRDQGRSKTNAASMARKRLPALKMILSRARKNPKLSRR